jgi:hypothetical protein
MSSFRGWSPRSGADRVRVTSRPITAISAPPGTPRIDLQGLEIMIVGLHAIAFLPVAPRALGIVIADAAAGAAAKATTSISAVAPRSWQRDGAGRTVDLTRSFPFPAQSAAG